MKRFLIALSTIFLIADCSETIAATATTEIKTDDVSFLLDKTLHKELQFFRILTEMRMANQLPTLANRRRQYLWNISNSAATEAGLIDATRLFFSHSDYRNEIQVKRDNKGTHFEIKGHENRVSGGANAGQLYPQIVGQEINAGGNAFELSINMFTRIKNARKKSSPKQALQRARSVLAEIDEHLDKLAVEEHISSTTNPPQLATELRLLRGLRDQLVLEFQKAYIGSQREYAYQNTLEFLDLSRNVVGAIGNKLSVRAGYTGNKHLNGLGNLLSELAAIGITTRPWLSLGAAKITQALATKKVRKELPLIRSEDEIENELPAIRNEAENQHPASGVGGRIAVLDAEAKLIETERENRERLQKGASKRVFYQCTRDTIYGPTKMANSILGIVVGYDTHLDATQRNRLNAAGALTYTIGQGLNLLELSRERIADEVSERNLKRDGKTTDQILHSQLESLDSLSNQLK